MDSIPTKPLVIRTEKPRHFPVSLLEETTTGLEPTFSTTYDRHIHLPVIQQLATMYPDAYCELNWRTPFELLVGVMLSAQCTDKKVNEVTPALFDRYPDPSALANSLQEDVEKLIYKTGFFRHKAANIRASAKLLVEKFHGEVPRNMNDLVTLPGVARKTANVVLGTAFGIASGVVVDTHVKRISQRLGLTKETDPVKIEKDLADKIPQDQWIATAHRMTWLGRRICFARNPDCSNCPLACISRRYYATRPSNGK